MYQSCFDSLVLEFSSILFPCCFRMEGAESYDCRHINMFLSGQHMNTHIRESVTWIKTFYLFPFGCRKPNTTLRISLQCSRSVNALTGGWCSGSWAVLGSGLSVLKKETIWCNKKRFERLAKWSNMFLKRWDKTVVFPQYRKLWRPLLVRQLPLLQQNCTLKCIYWNILEVSDAVTESWFIFYQLCLIFKSDIDETKKQNGEKSNIVHLQMLSTL